VLGKIPGVRHTETFPLTLNIKNIATWMPPYIFEDSKDQASKSPHRPQGE
jgi:hypothetical protein